MGDHKCFFYGTLMAPTILHRVIYGTEYPSRTPHLQAIASTLSFSPALLANFSRRHVRYADYPGIIAQTGQSVRGVLVTGLTERDLQLLDRFEGSQYEKEEVDVEVLKGEGKDGGLLGSVKDGKGERVKAQTYVFKEVQDLEDKEWDFEEFRREKMWRWASGSEEFEEVDEVVGRNGEGREEGEHDPTGGRGVNTKLDSERETEAQEVLKSAV